MLAFHQPFPRCNKPVLFFHFSPPPRRGEIKGYVNSSNEEACNELHQTKIEAIIYLEKHFFM
jgi:hypothetical protein